MNLLRTSALGLALAAAGLAQAAPINSEVDPSLTGATLYDFEAGPTGMWTSQAFGALTVTALPSTYGTDKFAVDSDFAGDYNTRGLYHITNYGSEFQVLRLDFGGPTTAFGFLFGASDATWVLSAFDASNTLLESRSIPAVFGSNAGDFFGLAGLSSATHATITQLQDGYYTPGGVDYVFVDNIRVAAVPEPETVALMLAGLVAVGQAVRRRRTA
jgi:hypothetical protein